MIMDFLEPEVEDFAAWLDARSEAGQGFAQKVEIDAARRLLTVDTESQPAGGRQHRAWVERSGTPG